MINLVKSRTKNVLSNEVGSSNVEIIVWIAVVLLIGVVIMAFGRTVRNKVQTAANTVGNMPVSNF